MTKIIKVNLKSIIEENQNLQNKLLDVQNQHYKLERQLTQIYSAKSYKLWQNYNKIKKYIFRKQK